MEIEKKYLILPELLPQALSTFPSHDLEQAYLCTEPVLRVRRQDDHYEMTMKGGGMMAREEYTLPLSEEAYAHLKAKADGNVITKTRYLLPLADGLTAEVDVFAPPFSPLIMAEVEFHSIEEAGSFTPPAWFGREVTYDKAYHNSTMSRQKF